MFKVVLLLIFSVLCVVSSDNGCGHSRSYTRVKRGKYPVPPIRIYSRPPITFPIKGPFSYTPPPFMVDDEPLYPGIKPYKVRKQPTNEGLRDDDINNLVKHLSKQDLDKILEFAGKDKYSKTIDDYGYSQPYKRGNSLRPTSKDFYNANIDVRHQDEKPYELDFKKYINYVTEPAPVNIQDDKIPITFKDLQFNQVYGQEDRLTQIKGYGLQDDQRISAPINENKQYGLIFTNAQEVNTNSELSDSYSETAEEEKLPPPDNMRVEDYEVSNTNNVPTVLKTNIYEVKNFGDLPLMNYNSMLQSVSSYHVPHYTVTQSKPQLSPSASAASFSSSQSHSSSSLLKPSPASASIKVPPFEPAPPVSAAKEQSDAHLKAIKIWSHRSKGAAYTLHDDGTLTPEFTKPKYG